MTTMFAVAVLGFLFWGATGWRHFHLGGRHTTNIFVLNYRVCNRLYQIINTQTQTNSFLICNVDH